MYNLYAVHEFFLSAEDGLEVLIKVTAEPIFLLFHPSLTSEHSGSDLGCGPTVEYPQSSFVTSTLLRMR